jgi:hypothetical protein
MNHIGGGSCKAQTTKQVLRSTEESRSAQDDSLSRKLRASISGIGLRGVGLREDRGAAFEARRAVYDLAGLRFGEA